ncbi:MAG: hypothetical protein WC581_08130 [Thermodesulfovibrionales bacterium]
MIKAFFVFFFALFLSAAFVSDMGYCEESEKKPVEIQTEQKPSVPVVGDAGTVMPDADKKADKVPVVDLVISAVEIIRGEVDGEKKIIIVPTVKNMWHGHIPDRIKILLDGLALAGWIEDGIGPGEEKIGGPFYVKDASGSTSLNFSVEVDDPNLIPETNEQNNRCENITFGPSQTQKIYSCPIIGPHGSLISGKPLQ